MVELRDEQAKETAETNKLEKKMGEFQFQEPDQMSGLGIAVNGNGNANGSEVPTKEFIAKSLQRVDTGDRPKTPPRQSSGSSLRKDTHTRSVSRTISSRPGSPYMSGGSRRDTLTIGTPVPIHSPSYGMPGIQVHRPSMTEGGNLTLSDISDDDLSWDDELDGPEDSDDEDQNSRELNQFRTSSGRNTFSKQQQQQDEDNDPSQEDPWNAVCVVGLRVFSKDTDLKIEVARQSGNAERDVREDVGRQDHQRSLDVDDANKDPSREPVSPISPVRSGGSAGESHADRSLRQAMMSPRTSSSSIAQVLHEL